MVQDHLKELGHKVVRNKEKEYDVILCWGCSTRELPRQDTPTLNADVNLFDKYQSLLRFRRAGITVPSVFSIADGLDKLEDIELPWYARKIYHEKGQDITVCKTEADVKAVVRGRAADFFSVYVPHRRELRLWVFGEQVFARYHKQYAKNDLFNFQRLESVSELLPDVTPEIERAAIKATKAVKMDFGAVDILEGKDNKNYVLEVNSMPDISSMIRVSGIRLAKLVSQWAEAQ